MWRITWETQVNWCWDLHFMGYRSALPWYCFLKERKSCRGGSMLSRKSWTQQYQHSSYTVLSGGQPVMTPMNDLQHPILTCNRLCDAPHPTRISHAILLPLKATWLLISNSHLSVHMGKSRFFPFREGSSNSTTLSHSLVRPRNMSATKKADLDRDV